MVDVDRMPDNEEVYDLRIEPLASAVAAICKEHNLPMLMAFEYAPGRCCFAYGGLESASQTLRLMVDFVHGRTEIAPASGGDDGP